MYYILCWCCLYIYYVLHAFWILKHRFWINFILWGWYYILFGWFFKIFGLLRGRSIENKTPSRLYLPIWIATERSSRLWSNAMFQIRGPSSFDPPIFAQIGGFSRFRPPIWNQTRGPSYLSWNCKVKTREPSRLITNGRLLMLQLKWEGTNGMNVPATL